MYSFQKAVLLSILSLVATSVLIGCSGGRRPVVQIQFCVEDERGMSLLKNVLRKSAADAGLPYIDYSTKRIPQLKATGASLAFLRKPEDYFEAWATHESDAGFSAGNLGLSSFEVSIGFNGGGDNGAEARSLAKNVISDLSKHWRIDLVPENRGALPTDRCPNSQAGKSVTQAPPNNSFKPTPLRGVGKAS